MTDLEARLAELRQRQRNLPQEQAAAAEIVREIASTTVTGRSSDGRIGVTANGRGVITDVDLSADTLRRLDSRALGEGLTEAVNRCLDEAEALRPQSTGALGLEECLDAAMDMFRHRIDGLLGRLDELGEGL